MIARINFLLGTALVLAMVMYLLGRFLIFTPIAWINPQWAYAAAGIWFLASLMLGVSYMSKIQTRLSAMPAAVLRSTGILGLVGQALLLTGHILSATAAYRWFQGTVAINLLIVLLPAIVYALGVAAVLLDLQRRAAHARS